MTTVKKLVPLALAGMLMGLVGCAHNVPTKSNMGYVYSPTISACRSAGAPSDTCVATDLRRCKALVDYANPGRDEATYTGIVNGLVTLAGSAGGLALANFKHKAFETNLEIIGGGIAGNGVGTALTYNKVLYRASVEACMFSFGRDPKLTEQYFGVASYTGQVESFDSVLPESPRFPEGCTSKKGYSTTTGKACY